MDLGWVPSPVTGVLVRELRDLDTETLGKEDHVKVEADAGVICLQAKDCQELLTNTRSGEGMVWLPPEPPEEQPCLHLSFRLLVSRSVR